MVTDRESYICVSELNESIRRLYSLAMHKAAHESNSICDQLNKIQRHVDKIRCMLNKEIEISNR